MRDIPSVDEVLRTDAAAAAIERFGHTAVVAAVRHELEAIRSRAPVRRSRETIMREATAGTWARLEAQARPNVRAVFNLTGTVLHTNLGRAVLAEAAIEAATLAMREAIALEFDLARGGRGERDWLVRELLCELTGGEDATLVNNNAAALLLVLNSLAKGRGAIVSRGELIEIGGAFRLPEIMVRAGAQMVEVGTTNRTHPADYAMAITAKTGLLLKVHTSNYRIEGFTRAVSTRELADIARPQQVPVVHDLGSGTLLDLSTYNLPGEPTVRETLAAGADIVTFSGDKLLGGPQAGFVVGAKSVIARINRNPLKRALRVDKIRLAAIEATLRLYRDPHRLTCLLPTFRHLTRSSDNIGEAAQRMVAPLTQRLGANFAVGVISCRSQIGSGALPQETLASAGIAIRPSNKRGAGRALAELAAGFRNLPKPVLGRAKDGALIFDLRCLEDEAAFLENLSSLQPFHAGAAKYEDEATDASEIGALGRSQ